MQSEVSGQLAVPIRLGEQIVRLLLQKRRLVQAYELDQRVGKLCALSCVVEVGDVELNDKKV